MLINIELLQRFIFTVTIAISFCGITFDVSAQSEIYHEEINRELLKIPKEDRQNPMFQKSLEYFFSHEPDSTIRYTYMYLQGNQKNSQLVDYCLFFRGRSFIDKGVFSQSEKSTLKISKNFPFQELVQMQLGTIYLESEKYQKALNYFYAIDSSAQPIKKVIDKSILHHNIGVCNLHLERYSTSGVYLRKALERQQQRKDTLLIIGSLMDLGNLFYIQYLDEEAIPYFQEAYDLSKKISDVELKQFTALNMAIVKENDKDYLSALSFYKEQDQWKDSLNNQQKVWDIAQLEKRFITERSKERIEVLQLERNTRSAQRNGFIYSSVFLLLLLLTAVYFYRQKNKANKIIASQKEELTEVNAMKDQLFSIVSHDLRSSVHAFRQNSEALASTIVEKNQELTEDQLANNKALADSTYHLLDNLLNWALLQTDRIHFMPEPTGLRRLCDQVGYNYLAMMSERRIEFVNSVRSDTHIFTDQESIKIVLRNVLDNAIKFTPKNGQITLSDVDSSNDFVELTIKDNGIGISEELIERMSNSSAVVLNRSSLNNAGSGLGLQVCKSMIQKNHGKFIIESRKGKGTCVKLILPKSS